MLLTIRQKAELRNSFNNNISTDLKLSRVQISKINQSGRFSESLLSKLAVPLMKVAIPRAKNVLASLGIIAATSELIQDLKKTPQKTLFWNNNINIFKSRNE